ncbi:hypothetical protein [Mesorhizobium sp. B1-1-5]|uniref:hypothetical protein n=1 Tax=Mesorhizobium sp. B1-1-5 TaxID=2589979 RepID=UPI001128AC51|nr:hypothetical protein [Mesorhizobium sp. B1-1-5]TPN90157.1 hypothetical protein FJ980_29575 [Mesorhizobium sp. B1-1-5]
MTDTFQSAGAAASAIVDRWRWYFAALKDPKEIGKSLPVHENEPQQGYYRTRNQAGGLDPVAIFYPEGSSELVAYRGGREVEPDRVWSFCCRMPVSYDAYKHATDHGGWPDDDATVSAQIAPAPPGHNSGDISEVEILRDQIEAAKKGANAYAKITDDAMLTKAQSLRSRLNELSGEADKKREALKRPHFEAGKAIDKEWQPLVKSAKEAADGIRAAMSAYETEKLRLQRETERKAEIARQQAEDEAKKAAEAGKPTLKPILPEPAPVAAMPAPIKGTYGKAASVKVKLIVTKVTDPAALFGFLNGHPELDDCMFKLAQRAIDAGRTVPGITTEEQAKVA